MTCGTEHLTANEFGQWLLAAKPGDRIVYATGALAASIYTADRTKDDNGPRIDALQEVTYRAYGEGKVHLVQKRLEEGKFEYRAVRSSRASP